MATIINETSFRTLREHRKSRFGCLCCKKRKVKCDELQPRCSACVARKSTCKYPENSDNKGVLRFMKLNRTKGNSKNQHTRPARDDIYYDLDARIICPTPMGMVVEPIACLPETNTTDMKMLWFFTTNTSQSFLLDVDNHHGPGNMLQTLLVEEALSSPFLLQTLLAIAAQHMNHLGQSISKTILLEYRQKAFYKHKHALETANRTTAASLLTNALMIELLPTDEFRDPKGKSLYILDWMLLWRGIGSIFCMFGGTAGVPPSPLMSLLSRPEVPRHGRDASAAVPGHLRLVVEQRCLESCAVVSDAYCEAMAYLGSLYKAVRNGVLDNAMIMRVASWMTFLPEAFIELCQKKDQLSLAIIAHYAAFLKLLDVIWWTEGIGSRTIRDIHEHLGLKWHSVLAVPLKALETNEQGRLTNLLALSD